MERRVVIQLFNHSQGKKVDLNHFDRYQSQRTTSTCTFCQTVTRAARIPTAIVNCLLMRELRMQRVRFLSAAEAINTAFEPILMNIRGGVACG